MPRTHLPSLNSGLHLVENVAWAGLGIAGLGGVLFAIAMFAMFADVALFH